jgi:hypothetical protein
LIGPSNIGREFKLKFVIEGGTQLKIEGNLKENNRLFKHILQQANHINTILPVLPDLMLVNFF